MAQLQTVEAQISIKSNADKFFHLWAHKLDNASKNIFPDKLPKAELLEGNCHAIGSLMIWTYVANGKSATAKTITEELDEKNRSVTYKGTEGEILETHYKSLKTRIQVIPKGDENCIVKWAFYYEKLNEQVHEPHPYVDLLINCAKDIEAHLCNA